MDKLSAANEKRASPRVNISFPFNIPPSFLAQGVDISETGLSFILDKPLLLSKAKAEVEIAPGKKIETEFKIVWSKQLVESGKFRYGAAFIRFKAKDLDLFETLIINRLLEEQGARITDSGLRQRFCSFWQKDFIQYLRSLREFSETIQPGEALDEGKVTKLRQLNNQIVVEGEDILTLAGDKILAKHTKETFRNLGGAWFYRSEMMHKGFKKIRGYPGDYEMMEFIYNQRSVSADPLGSYFDWYFINNPYAEAVRGRKDKMVELLRQQIGSSVKKNLAVLNVACGPCREIRELYQGGFKSKTKVHYVCTDFEEEALRYSKDKLAGVKSDFRFNFLKEDIMNFLRRPGQYAKRLGKFDLVYSIGLGDYLPDIVVKKLMKFCWGFLRSGATMVFAHKIEDRDPFAPAAPAWFCDWEFVPRSEKDIDGLIASAGLSNFSIEKDWEKSGRILFVKITKEK